MHILSRTPQALKDFVALHDDLPAFRAGYLVLTILVAALFNLGTFAMLIVAHISLDIVKYREHHGFSWRKTVEGIWRENLFDCTLLLIGFVFAVYFHHTVGIAGVSGLMRADITIVRGLGTLVPKAEILNDFLHVLARLWGYFRFPHLRMGLPLQAGERLLVFLFAASCLLLIIAPSVLGMEGTTYLGVLAEEGIPWGI